MKSMVQLLPRALVTLCFATFLVDSTTVNIQEEGLACVAIAAAFPSLQSLTGLPIGNTKWETTVSQSTIRDRNVEGEQKRGIGAHKKNEIDSTEWNMQSALPSWCSYYGVTCSNVSGTPTYASVLSIDLASMNLTGTIPTNIGNFINLKYLNLRDNRISGEIPSVISQLKSLETLRLEHNFLTSVIPSTISCLYLLEHLGISDNKLEGSLPSDIGIMTSLKKLYLEENSLSGSIPLSFGALKSLEEAFLSSNFLTGTIPSSIKSLSSLEILLLNENLLIGTIPSAIGGATSLTNLRLDFNQLIGTIPSAFGFLESMVSMQLNSNGLMGTIPTGFSHLTMMTSLDLSLNFLTSGSVTQLPSSTFSNSTLSGDFNVSNNCLKYVSDTQPNHSTEGSHCAPSASPTSAPSHGKSGIPSRYPTVFFSKRPTYHSSSPAAAIIKLSVTSDAGVSNKLAVFTAIFAVFSAVSLLL